MTAVPHRWPICAAVCWATFVSVSLQLGWQGGEEAVPTATLAAGVDLPPDEAARGAAADATPTGGPAMRNFRRVFGPSHPLTWLLPAWGVAEAPATGRLKDV